MLSHGRCNAKTSFSRSILGQQGVNLIEDHVLAMGFAWHPTNQSLEVGIDGHIELREVQTGRMSSFIPVCSEQGTDNA